MIHKPIGEKSKRLGFDMGIGGSIPLNHVTGQDFWCWSVGWLVLVYLKVKPTLVCAMYMIFLLFLFLYCVIVVQSMHHPQIAVPLPGG